MGLTFTMELEDEIWLDHGKIKFKVIKLKGKKPRVHVYADQEINVEFRRAKHEEKRRTDSLRINNNAECE